MAKYIIDIPEDTTCLNALRYEDGKCVSARSYIIPDLTPYVRSESYIDGLKEGQNDAWKFARKMISTSENEVSEMWGCATNFGEVMHNTTYSEAKSKYEEWKKEKEEEVHIGDEVFFKGGPRKEKAIVLRLYQPKLHKPISDVLWADGSVETKVLVEKLMRTDRHFDEVEKLLERMKAE